MQRKEVFTMILRGLMPLMAVVLILDIYLRLDEEGLQPQTRGKAVIETATEIRNDLNQAMELLEECFGHPVDLKNTRSVPVTITAYASTVGQCDSTPYLTASDRSVHVGIIAISDDLVHEMGLKFGQRVLIPGHGLFEVQDRMHSRWKRRVDIWQEDREVARRFGSRQGTLIWIDPGQNRRTAQIAGTPET